MSGSAERSLYCPGSIWAVAQRCKLTNGHEVDLAVVHLNPRGPFVPPLVKIAVTVVAVVQ